MKEGLAILVIGASGDLAKKKTYPSLLNLYHDDLLPVETVIYGYARSAHTDESLRAHLKPYLMSSGRHPEEVVDGFLSNCFYQRGKSYGDVDAFREMMSSVERHERDVRRSQGRRSNRLFYLAVPPNVFGETAVAIRQTGMMSGIDGEGGFRRIVIEKPFGRDLQSCDALSRTLAAHFDETDLYRIDHYLGKEMVQNLLVLRFTNRWLEPLWNRHSVQSVVIHFKEPFGTEGRGGYFDQYGIIRDIMQNHLLQVVTLLAMEPPKLSTISAIENEEESIRDAKVKVLNDMPPIHIEDCMLGQYVGYADDPTVPTRDSPTATYAALRCYVNNPRWEGVPFIMTAGKALNERKVEVRIQFHEAAPGMPRNELVLRLQPDPTVYMMTNVKAPGYSSQPIRRVMELDYSRDESTHSSRDGTDCTDSVGSGAIDENPDAYTRLILDVLRGRRASFVRGDELRRSWEIFTPLLSEIEKSGVRPEPYERGTCGPEGAGDFIRSMGGFVIEDSEEETTVEEVLKQRDEVEKLTPAPSSFNLDENVVYHVGGREMAAVRQMSSL